MPKKVFLWTSPRSISSAFARCIMEVENSKVFHEPFAKPYHFGPERQSPRYLSEEVDPSATNNNVKCLLNKEYDGLELVFSKDMAYAIENHFEILLDEDLSNFQHTFLVRNPQKSVPSLYKASMNTQLTGWNYFNPHEAGLKQVKGLYEFVQKNFEENPVVIDADDLQRDPEGTIKAYFTAIAFPFDRKILSWQAVPVPDWDEWNGWYDDVLKSTGFRQQTPMKTKDLLKYPKEVQICVDEVMPIYEFLKNNKLHSSTRS